MADDRELRATSDKMLDMLERVRELEDSKRNRDIGTDEFVAAAAEVERLARVLFRWSQLQLQLARDADREGASRRPLTAVASRPLDRILADWREAQLRLEGARPGSPEAESAANDVERLRDEFRAAQESRSA